MALSSVKYVLLSVGVELRDRFMNSEQVERAVQLYDKGATLKQIGSEVGFDQRTVRRVLVKHGLVLRKRSPGADWPKPPSM